MAVVGEEAGFRIYTDLEKSGELPIRVVGSLLDSEPKMDPLPRRLQLKKDADTELVQARVLKIIMDGADANATAAMLRPYTDDRTSRGTPKFSPSQLESLVKRADAAGVDVRVHCLGTLPRPRWT